MHYTALCLLTVTKGIVDLHGGKISVHSDGEGLGSTFTLELPVHRAGFTVDDNIDCSPINSRMDSVPAGTKVEKFEGGFQSIFSRDSVAHSLMKESEGGRSSLHRIVSVVSADIMEGKNEFGRSRHAEFANIFEDSVPSSNTTLLEKKCRVLIADDALMNRKMLKRLLTPTCDVLAEAEDGLQVVLQVTEAVTRSEPFHVILMDYHMPTMDGPTATQKLRGMGCTSVIVGVTGSSIPQDIENFMSHGADMVLTKPVTVEALNKIIKGITSTLLSIFFVTF